MNKMAAYSGGSSSGERVPAPPHRTRHYVFVFIGLLTILTLLDLRVENRTDYGLERLENRRARLVQQFQRDDHLYDPASIAERLGVSIEEVHAGQYFLEAYLNYRDAEQILQPAPLVSFTVAELRFQPGPYWPSNFIIAALGAVALALRDRLRQRSVILQERGEGLRAAEEKYETHLRETAAMVEEFEQLRHRLGETEKLASIGRLSATLAHEIRNPLSIIKSSTEIALDDVPADSSSAGAIALIREEITRLDRIIGELLKFARPRQPRIECHNARELVRHWLPPIVEELDREGIQLVPELESSVDEVLVDADHLYQVLLNVVWNARDALKGTPQPRIFVRLESREDGYTALEIEDNGAGMLPDTLEQIREPFYTTKTQGTGLGVPVSVQLLEMMGGKFEVESELERGTIVRLLLRRSVAPSAGAGNSRPATDPLAAHSGRT